LEEDAIMLIASCTKLITTIVVLQCVERDLIGLDDDLATILPELAELEVLTGIDNKGAPELKKRKNKITLR
jgi:CubicO group peptidase (beta-lactamase class C family)